MYPVIIIVAVFCELLSISVIKADLLTTTTTYDLDVPGSNPIRIIEGENPWAHRDSQENDNVKRNERAYHADSEEERDALEEFLKNLRKNKYKPSLHQNRHGVELENVEVITKPSNRLNVGYYAESNNNNNNNNDEEVGEEKKSWDLLHFEKHHHPYDDKKGWVSMEPVPWSVSKVSKWQSSQKPITSQKPSWDLDYGNEEISKPASWSSKPYRPYETRPSTNLDIYVNKPNYDNKPDVRPIFSRPSAVFGQKVHVDYNNNNKYPHKHDENCNHNKQQQHQYHQNSDGDIITDGLPANFPQAYEASRRRGTDMHPESHPFSGEGEWVLLSTTKGYKYPQQRQRSVKFSPDSVGVTHGVQLTVLPPLKNSKINMTTSHGGLLQVESTFQTVEQAKNQYMNNQKNKNKKKRKQPSRVVQGVNKPRRQVATPTFTTTTTNTKPDSSAVLAAVGAGMIPATMAMLVPMALGGKRRKREVSTILPVTNLEMTLARNM